MDDGIDWVKVKTDVVDDGKENKRERVWLMNRRSVGQE